MKELHVSLHKLGATTKLHDENGTEIQNVTKMRIEVDSNGFATAILTMHNVILDGVVDGKHVVILPEEKPS